MSNFRFKLETVQRLRESERDTRRAEFAKALRAEAILREQQAKLEQDIEETKQVTRRLSEPGQANVDGLLQMHRYELILKIQTQQLAQQMQQVQTETERRRQALVEADRQVRVLEKLRERKAAAHRLLEEQSEMKELDDVAVLGYALQEEGDR